MKAELIDSMGDDLLVVNSARVSFDKESDWENPLYREDWEYPRVKEKDRKLIHYLAKHGHFTPFTHPQITLRITVPIFVARQDFKHQIGFTRNEVSRRYVDDEPEFYVPEVWRSRPEGSVKQGSGGENLTHKELSSRLRVDNAYALLLDHAENLYSELLESGVAPEQARMVLPQSMYTSYYTTGSLAAWARAYKLRTDSHAQKETQVLYHQVGSIIAPLFPESWSALTE